MTKRVTTTVVLALLANAALAAQTTPEDDLKSFRVYFSKRFYDVPLEEYKNGVYAIDADSRASWEAIEEFPPYEEELKKGEILFKTKFANGATYASCFRNGGIGIRQNYPYFDPKSGEVKTLEMEVNECRQKNSEKPLNLSKGEMAQIVAYMASTSNGMKLDIKVPDDPRALDWYQKGKQQFFMKRGQLNMACADCHYYNAGNRIRGDILSPALGHPTHFPAYRLAWENLGTLHRRYEGCQEQIRAKPFKPQGPEYRALEYYITFMSNGIPVNAPSSRK